MFRHVAIDDVASGMVFHAMMCGTVMLQDMTITAMDQRAFLQKLP